MTAAAIISHRISAAISVAENATLLEISRRLTGHKCGALVVLSEDGGLAGIITDVDLVRALSEHGSDALSLTARDVMTRTVHTCSLQETELQIMNAMIERQIRHMPVLHDGKVVGMVTLSDAVRHRLVKIRQLSAEAEREPDHDKRLGIFTQHLKKRSASTRP